MRVVAHIDFLIDDDRLVAARDATSSGQIDGDTFVFHDRHPAESANHTTLLQHGGQK